MLFISKCCVISSVLQLFTPWCDSDACRKTAAISLSSFDVETIASKMTLK